MGTDKAFLDIEGRPLIDRTLEVLHACCTDVLIVTKSREPYRDYVEERIVLDAIQEGGPLGGLYTGLEAMANEYGFFVACDMPNLHIALLRPVLERLAASSDDAVVIRHGAYVEPLCAAYSKRIVPIVLDRLHRGDYKLHDLLRDIAVSYVDIGDDAYAAWSCQNINTQGEYLQMRRGGER